MDGWTQGFNLRAHSRITAIAEQKTDAGGEGLANGSAAAAAESEESEESDDSVDESTDDEATEAVAAAETPGSPLSTAAAARCVLTLPACLPACL
jgi:uncharacterized protein YfaS (alpha-2-macroglobulin family)